MGLWQCPHHLHSTGGAAVPCVVPLVPRWGERPEALMCSAAGQPLLGAKQRQSRPGCAPPAPYGRGRCYRTVCPFPRIEMEMKPSVLPADTGAPAPNCGQGSGAGLTSPAPQRAKGGPSEPPHGMGRPWDTHRCPHTTRGGRCSGWLIPAVAYCWRCSWRAPGSAERHSCAQCPRPPRRGQASTARWGLISGFESRGGNRAAPGPPRGPEWRRRPQSCAHPGNRTGTEGW